MLIPHRLIGVRPAFLNLLQHIKTHQPTLKKLIKTAYKKPEGAEAETVK